MGGASLPVNGVGPGMDKIKNMENKKGVPPPLSRPQSNGPPSRPDQVKTKSTKSDHLHLHGSIRIATYPIIFRKKTPFVDSDDKPLKS